MKTTITQMEYENYLKSIGIFEESDNLEEATEDIDYCDNL